MNTPLLYPVPEIVFSLRAARHALLEASAGTGKTFALEHLVVDLLLERGARLDEILVVTFTEKAAIEMRGRIRKTLEAIQRGDGASGGNRGWVVATEAVRRVRTALAAFDTASISTIHSFCRSVLREHAFAGGRPLEQQPVDGEEAYRAAFRRTLRRLAAPGPFLPWLSAWLDSGRTAGDLEDLLAKSHGRRGELRPRLDGGRLRRAVEALDVDPSRDDAAIRAEMKAAGARSSTPGCVAKKVLRLAGLLLPFRGFEPSASLVALLDGDEARETRDYLRGKWALFSPPATSRTGELRTSLDRIWLAAPPLGAAVVSIAAGPVSDEFRRSKEAGGLFDYDDMIGLVDAAIDGPAGDALAAAIRHRWRYVLIDEFQDTDERQWHIFRRVFLDAASTRLLVIGDPKQSIYTFRGADLDSYFEARRTLLKAGAVQHRLSVNFRSTAALLEAYNTILDPTGREPLFSGANEYPEFVTPCPAPPEAVGPGGAPAPPVVLLRVDGSLGAPELRTALGKRIAKEIASLLNPAAPSLLVRRREEAHPVQAGEIFVLTRSNSDAEEMGEHLRRAGIRFAFFKQEGLFQRPEVAQVLALLRAVADPWDRNMRFQAFLTPFFGHTLEELSAAADLPASHPSVAALVRWKALADARRFSRLFRAILSESGVLRRLVAESASERELTNLQHVLDLLAEEAERSRVTLGELTTRLSDWIAKRSEPEGEDGSVQRLESERDAVQVMTVHKAKGLEASVVFLYGGFFSGGKPPEVRTAHEERRRVALVGSSPDPSLESAAAIEASEEDQRVLYVALTRARARLYLPFLPEPLPGQRDWDGPWSGLNRRLRAIVAAGGRGVAGSPVARLLVESPVGDPGLQTPSYSVDLSGWQPAEEALAEPPDLAAQFELLKKGREGFFVTSYTDMKRLAGGYRAPLGRPAAGVVGAAGAAASFTLPGGIAAGTMLHSVLEEVDPSTFEGSRTSSDWSSVPAVAALLSRRLRAGGFDPDPAGPHFLEAARLVHNALTAPVPLPGGSEVVSGLGRLRNLAREIEFLYPVPEETHPLLSNGRTGGSDPLPFAIGRGCVTGYVDLLFTRGTKTFFLDWKSDALPSWDTATLERHVEENYSTQAHLYTIALLRILAVDGEAAFETRFGGFLYVFLRGVDPAEPGKGIFSRRPSWADVLSMEEDLKAGGLFAPREGP